MKKIIPKPSKDMNWRSALAISKEFDQGLRDVVAQIQSQNGSKTADFGILFMSARFRQDIIDLWPTLRKEIPVKTIVGCTGGGIIGGNKEIEEESAISLMVADLPGVKIQTFSVRQENIPSSDGSPRPWRDLVSTEADPTPHFVILADPFSIDTDQLIGGLDFSFPESSKVGGLASGGMAPGENLLISDQKVLARGAVGVSLSGNIDIKTIVAQGCRPIGKPLTVTGASENMLLSLDNKPPIKAVAELYESLSERDRELLKTSLFVGLVMDPFNKNPKQGDFLIRNIIGLDQENGILALGAFPRVGQTLQFQLRDAATSKEDLEILLSNSFSDPLRQSLSENPSHVGAVLFSCLGRGHRLYGEANHDTNVFKNKVGDIPLAGFFCNGEIGPVGGKTYLHGYTSSIAVFHPSKLTPTKNSLPASVPPSR